MKRFKKYGRRYGKTRRGKGRRRGKAIRSISLSRGGIRL